MRLDEIFKDMVFEAAMSNAVYNRLYDIWKNEKPDINRDEIQTIYDEFKIKQNGLSINKPEVRSFLFRFDGNHGYPKFNPDYIRDITKYSYNQIKSLLDEYKDNDFEQMNDQIFSSKDTKSTPEKIDASKQLWFGSNFLIINENGLRVYKIPNQATSVKFGYYAEKINIDYRINNPDQESETIWCVTWRPNMIDGRSRTNMWGSYRDKRTFYFVIDESKGVNDKYYLSALQKAKDVSSGYRLTSLINDGDNPKTWSEIVRIYPNIEPHKDKIVNVEYSNEDELEEKNIVGQINETPNSRYEFSRVERPLKKAYINNNGILNNPNSWAHMDNGLRNLYITTATSQNIFQKFNNFQFINEIKKVGNEFNLLNNRMKTLGYDGVSNIIDKILSNEFKIRRTSLNKPHLKIYQSKVNGYCGLYDTKKFDWVRFNGINFTPEFSLDKGVDSFIDENGELFILEKYKNGGSSFICIIPHNPKNKGKGYIMSQEKFEELQNDVQKKINLDTSKGPKMGNINPDTDTDIDEINKGL